MQKHQNAYKLSDLSEYSLTPNRQNYTINPSTNGKEFIISEYLSLLGEKSSKGYYFCPICCETKLSINKDGLKYDCYSCHNKSEIASFLVKQAQQNSLNNGANEYPKSSSEFHVNFKGSDRRAKDTNQEQLEGETLENELLEKLRKNKRNGVKQTAQFIDTFLPQLRFNTIENEAYLKDKQFCKIAGIPEEWYLWVLRKYDVVLPKNVLIDAIQQKARQSSYNPIVEHLEGLAKKYPIGYEQALKITRSIATTYFRTDSELYDTYCSLWGLASIARPFMPGCLFRHILVLSGGQGIGKSSFLRIWGGNWFTDSVASITRFQDVLQIAYKSWVIEAGEVDGFLRKRDQADVKRQLSAVGDEFRLPYARFPMKLLRHFLFAASTNEDQYLLDITGNDRYWHINIPGLIKLTQWEQDRDKVLAAFVTVFKEELKNDPFEGESFMNGTIFRIPSHLIALHSENTRSAEVEHPWVEILRDTVIYELSMHGYVKAQSLRDQLSIANVDAKRYNLDIKTAMQGGFGLINKRVYDEHGKQIRAWVATDRTNSILPELGVN